MNVPWEEFDLSALTYPQFLAFFLIGPSLGVTISLSYSVRGSTALWHLNPQLWLLTFKRCAEILLN